MTNVLLVTTWGIPCGIAEHSAYLKESVEAADPEIHLEPWTDLHPESIRHHAGEDLIWLNYHAALHSQWTPDWIRRWQEHGIKVGCTYHDTGVPNSDQAKRICAAADCAVVHEPFDDLDGNVHYIRQGIPSWPAYPEVQDRRTTSWCGSRPIVGTVGFPFPWKNYELLCEASALAGWAVLLLAPGATDDQVANWQALNPHSLIIREFTPRDQVVRYLAGCDATAFLYSCANTGTSGAIRQGIAARKPVLALSGCRQFRDLEEVSTYITWVFDGTPHGVAGALAGLCLGRVQPGIVALAEQDSWTSVGRRYAALYRSLL